ncbi:MAG: hypothetical protein JXR58_07190 [Bacteroidales bacterium]|nr:hypothetical protein [Bacteroidales bacterium]
MRTAIIDLGTNTFNLIVADVDENCHFTIKHRDKIPVKLGMNGINKGIIMPDAMERGLVALQEHLVTAKSFNPEKISAYGTSALRTAYNSEEFINQVKCELGLDIEIITGEMEAEYTYYGIKNAVQLDSEYVLMLDIGGGSNEFIIANESEIVWKKSYMLGMSRVLERFQPSDPILPQEILAMEKYFDEHLTELYEKCKKFEVETLIGSSGSFDSFATMITYEYYATRVLENITSFRIPLNQFYHLHSQFISTTSEERKKMRGLELMRVEMIHLASIFVNHLLQKLPIENLIQSDYSLKEGLILQSCIRK